MKKYDYCTMIGNPAYYSSEFRDYSVENIEKLKKTGVNKLLANIAFSRPFVDPVLMEHLVVSEEFPLTSSKKWIAEYEDKIKERIKNIHSCGLRAVGLFGIPLYADFLHMPEKYRSLLGSTKSLISPDQVACIKSEAVIRYYKELILLTLKKYDYDEFLIYTYDEFAEVCDEDSDCPRCKGIPIEDRLPQFLNELNEFAHTVKKDFKMYWEPWELSASQVYLSLETLDKSIGISCHSTLYEVYQCNHPDIFVRNIGMICKRQGREFVIEMFMTGSGEDLGPVAGYPSPRLMYEQIKALELVEGVTGIKEYFGMALKYYSVNEKMTASALQNNLSYEDNINDIISEFTDNKEKQSLIAEAYEYSSQALLMAPWDISWVFRFSNMPPYDAGYWSKLPFKELMKTPWNTPSWLANRRSYYITVDSTHNWNKHTVRDFEKRMRLSLDYADKAIYCLKNAELDNQEILMQIDALSTYYTILKSRHNYFRISNIVESKIKDVNAVKEILTDDISNAHKYMELCDKVGFNHYFDNKITANGIEYIQKILDDVDNYENYFSF